jgi:hypothetical protein
MLLLRPLGRAGAGALPRGAYARVLASLAPSEPPRRVLEHQPSLDRPPTRRAANDPFTYTLQVFTGDRRGASTSAQVHATLIGSESAAGPFALVGEFQRATRQSFCIQASAPIGSLQARASAERARVATLCVHARAARRARPLLTRCPNASPIGVSMRVRTRLASARAPRPPRRAAPVQTPAPGRVSKSNQIKSNQIKSRARARPLARPLAFKSHHRRPPRVHGLSLARALVSCPVARWAARGAQRVSIGHDATDVGAGWFLEKVDSAAPRRARGRQAAVRGGAFFLCVVWQPGAGPFCERRLNLDFC